MRIIDKGFKTCFISVLLAAPNQVGFLGDLGQHDLRTAPSWFNALMVIATIAGFFGWILPVVGLAPAILNSVRKHVAWYLRVIPWAMVIQSACGFWSGFSHTGL
jgi:hypothetical protein